MLTSRLKVTMYPLRASDKRTSISSPGDPAAHGEGALRYGVIEGGSGRIAAHARAGAGRVPYITLEI